MNIDLSNFLPYYRSWVTNVLQRHSYDAVVISNG